jgi:serpin B
MKKYLLLAVLALIALFGWYCSDNKEQPTAPSQLNLTPENLRISQSDNQFGINLFKETARDDTLESIFLSPLSVAVALGMVYNGADGNTKAQMAEVLGYTGLSDQEINESYALLIDYLTTLDSKVTCEIANSIWYYDGFELKQSFLDENSKYFDAEIAGLDFGDPASANTINNWVSEKTHDKITEIISPDALSELMLLLANAVYFYGDWTITFPDSLTKSDHFTAADGTVQDIEMMFLLDSLNAYENSEFKMIELDYGNGDFAATIILPDTSVDINNLIDSLTPEKLSNWHDSLDLHLCALHLPKFELEYDISLVNVLSRMGITDAFGAGANFSRMRPARDLFISSVRHKTYVSVDEQGTEAAAVTVIGMTTGIDEPVIFDMRVDRPFLFIVWEKTSGSILFIGRISDLSS